MLTINRWAAVGSDSTVDHVTTKGLCFRSMVSFKDGVKTVML